MNIIVFFLCAVPFWVLMLAVASGLSDRAHARRMEREHPGQRWTPAGWKPAE